MAHRVILGAGIGGRPCAHEMRKTKAGHCEPIDDKPVQKAIGIVRLAT